MRVEVMQLRKRIALQSSYEVFRNEAGLPERIKVESTAGDGKQGWQGDFSADGRVLHIQVAAATSKRSFNVPANLVLPDQLAVALEPLWKGDAQGIEIPYLEPTVAQPVALRVDRLTQADAAGTRIKTTDLRGRRDHTEILWYDTAGRLLHKERDFFGATLKWDRCPQDCTAPVDKPYDLLSKLIVQSPFRVPESAFQGPIRFILSRMDGKAPEIPVTSEQSVAMDGGKAIVTVCVRCEFVEHASESERQRFLRPNAWVQSDAKEIKDFVRRHGLGKTPGEIMLQLVEAVRNHMTGAVDYMGPANAVDALRTRAGDCAQFAVLLAALARAKNIPARIAYGLVYADRFSGKKDVFSPHAWVQAWTGTHWQSFDAGIGQFDATHLALGIGDGDPNDSEAGYMKPADVRIENLGRVR
jgi:hypothetical protein